MNETIFDIALHANRPTHAKTLNDLILAGQRKGYQDFVIRFEETRTYSNVNRSIQQRMAQIYYDEIIDESKD